ncbi:MAG: hypothetical protein J5826_04395, partial [Bacteroidales bacterium]|nr:hypothetical protein [Bacteroidales bacterium]
PDNTLLRPFIVNEDVETQYLSGDTVLDITHEALIRNWKMLDAWNAEEYADTKDFYDFNSQMKRWLENDRKIGFLLPAGNLGYFESWYDRVRPNTFWLAKQDTGKKSLNQKLKTADVQARNCRDFITESRYAVDLAHNVRKRKNRIIGALVIGSSIFLAGLTAWALMERNTAKEQSEIAEQKSAEAEQKSIEAEHQAQISERERDRADSAALAAETERQHAVSEAERARRAQEDALRAYQSADAARILADSMKNTALRNLNEAEKARKVAEEQTRIADKASDSAARLYNIAVSNALALKAKNRYEDKTMNLRLAWSAWLINKQFNITENTPTLYEAMISAVQENGFDNSLKINDNDCADFFIDGNNHLYTVTRLGEVAAYKMSGDRPKEYLRFKSSASSAPIQKVYFLSNKYLIYSTVDKKNYFTDIASQSTVQFKNSGYINAAALLNNGGRVVVALDNGNIFVYDTQSADKGFVNAIDLKQKIMDVCPSPQPNQCYVMTHNGRVLKYNTADGSTKEIFSRPMHIGSAMTTIPDKNLLVACYADGTIFYIDTQTDKMGYEFTGGHAKVEKAIYDPVSQYLALSSADKRITLLDTKNFELQPFYIEETNLRSSRVNSLCFNKKGMLFALNDKNNLLYWDTDITQYAESLETLNLQPLTANEKNLVLGREFAGGW